MESYIKTQAQRLEDAEREKRRRQRITQVREQTNKWISQSRENFETEVSKKLKELIYEVTNDITNSAIQDLEKLQQDHEKTMQEIGQAHRAAANYPDFNRVKAIKKMENDKKAKQRHDVAIMCEKLEQEQRRENDERIIKRRKSVREEEDEKAKSLVERRPFRRKNPPAKIETLREKLKKLGYQQSIAKTLFVPQLKNTPAEKRKRSPQKRRKSPSPKSPPDVIFADARIPLPPQKYRPPKGLTVREPINLSKPSAWQQAEILNKDRELKERQIIKNKMTLDMKTEERGRKALKLARLESRYKALATELLSPINEEGLNIESPPPESKKDEQIPKTPPKDEVKTKINFTEEKNGSSLNEIPGIKILRGPQRHQRTTPLVIHAPDSDFYEKSENKSPPNTGQQNPQVINQVLPPISGKMAVKENPKPEEQPGPPIAPVFEESTKESIEEDKEPEKIQRRTKVKPANEGKTKDDFKENIKEPSTKKPPPKKSKKVKQAASTKSPPSSSIPPEKAQLALRHYINKLLLMRPESLSALHLVNSGSSEGSSSSGVRINLSALSSIESIKGKGSISSLQNMSHSHGETLQKSNGDSTDFGTSPPQNTSTPISSHQGNAETSSTLPDIDINIVYESDSSELLQTSEADIQDLLNRLCVQQFGALMYSPPGSPQAPPPGSSEVPPPGSSQATPPGSSQTPKQRDSPHPGMLRDLAERWMRLSEETVIEKPSWLSSFGTTGTFGDTVIERIMEEMEEEEEDEEEEGEE